MIPRLLAWLFGASWRTTLAGYAGAALEGVQAVPAIVTGTATADDWRRAGIAVAIAVLGRLAHDSGASDSTPPVLKFKIGRASCRERVSSPV